MTESAFVEFWLEPWRLDPQGYFWVFVMGALVAATCGVLGCFLILRRNALLGDAISHAVLPGILVAALFTHSLVGPQIVLGALVAAVICVALIHAIYGYSRVKEDAAIGIAFTTLFALGVIGVSSDLTKGAHIDTECILYGEIEYVALEPTIAVIPAAWRPAALQTPERAWLIELPRPVILMAIVTLVTLLGVGLFYKQLLISSFDPGLSLASGVSPILVHYALMGMTALAAVSAFNAVGAILVVAMLVIPGATAYLLTDRLPVMLAMCVVQGILYSFVGMTTALGLPTLLRGLGLEGVDDVSVSTAGMMVVVAFVGFLVVWFVSPRHGLISWWLARHAALEPPVFDDAQADE